MRKKTAQPTRKHPNDLVIPTFGADRQRAKAGAIGRGEVRP